MEYPKLPYTIHPTSAPKLPEPYPMHPSSAPKMPASYPTSAPNMSLPYSIHPTSTPKISAETACDSKEPAELRDIPFILNPKLKNNVINDTIAKTEAILQRVEKRLTRIKDDLESNKYDFDDTYIKKLLKDMEKNVPA